MLQDPAGALNPRHTVYDSVAEGIRLHRLVAHDTQTDRAQRRTETELVAAALSSAGLRPPERLFLRYPHELSGGQRQRVLIAGALAMAPELLVADEPVSSLDASIRGEILALLLTLRRELGLGVLVVTHDLGLAWNIADRIAVMYLGRVVEAGPTEDVLRDPQHPYTRALLSVVPEIDHMQPVVLTGEVPDPTRIPGGCRFHPRCPALADGSAAAAGVADACRGTALDVVPAGEGHHVACHLVAARQATGRQDSPGVSGLQAALPREMYVDQAAWARERERVLFATWACVGRVDDLGLDEPGRLAVVDVVGESVVLTRDDDGLHAAYNVCRHRGSQLVPREPGAEPVCSAARARCAARTTRGPTRWPAGCSRRRTPRAPRSTRRTSRCTRSAVEEWAGFVFVNLTPAPDGQSAEPFADGVAQAAANLGNYDMGSLVTGLTLTYDVAANWKVLAENYNECYHCGPVHPELVRLVPAFGGGGTDLEWDDGIPHREGAWTFTMSGTTNRAPLPGLSEAEKVRHKGELVYPNLMLSCSADHVAAFVLRPLAVDRTRIDCSLLFARDAVAAADFDPSDAGDFWDLVNKQDWAICESVQRGMSSRAYTHGWFAPMEDDSADIRRWLLPRLE